MIYTECFSTGIPLGYYCLLVSKILTVSKKNNTGLMPKSDKGCLRLRSVKQKTHRSQYCDLYVQKGIIYYILNLHWSLQFRIASKVSLLEIQNFHRCLMIFKNSSWNAQSKLGPSNPLTHHLTMAHTGCIIREHKTLC